MKHAIFNLILIISLLNICYGQDYPRKEVDASSLVDEIFATQDLDINYQDLYENYLQLISNPFDLNSVNAEQLAALYLLSPQQINSFLKYRLETGSFLSVYELQGIEGFNKDVFLKLIPFIKVENPNSLGGRNLLKRIGREGNNYLLMRYAQTLEDQKGYASKSENNSRYSGSPGNFYTRFRASKAGDYSVGFTFEKDAGEAITWNPSKKIYGFDYQSFHLQLINKNKIKNLIIGDFQAQFGQGIAMGSVFGIGKNGEAVTTIRRSNLGFLPYTSIYEAGNFRGAALSYEITKQFTIHTMASIRGRDGNLQDTIQNAVSSFNFSGLHRTPYELENRNILTESNFALIANYKTRSLDAGLLVHNTQFSIPIQRTINQYNRFAFNGIENTNLGAFINYSFNNVSFFGEIVNSLHQGTGAIAGLLASLTPKFDVSLMYRKFDRNYYSFYSNALAENSTAQNESGTYWGWKYTFNKKYSISGYVDIFRFPWLRSTVYSPSDGSEWLLRFNYKPGKTINLFIQAKEESKQRNSETDSNLYTTDLGIRRSYWANLDYSASSKISFRSRAQFSTFDFSGKQTEGMAIMQDVTLNVKRITISGRYVLFDSEDYNNRLYVYENDVWLAFTFPAYSGKGVRQFLLLQYHLNSKIDFWVRWAQTRYTDRDQIGSGGELIIGNTRNDVRFQVRIKL